ncbi:23108_t:CDS:2, partial [Gigaspora rosea]
GIEFYDEYDKENWNYKQFRKYLTKENIHVQNPLETWNANLRYIKSHIKLYDVTKKQVEKIQNETNKRMKIYEPKLKPQQPSKGKLNSLSKQPPLKLDRQKPNSLSEQTSLLPQASRSSSSSLLPQASRSPSRSPLSSLPLPLISSPSLPSTSILLLPPTPPTPSVISSSWSNETYPDAPLFGGVLKLSNGKTVRETIFPIYEQADSS